MKSANRERDLVEASRRQDLDITAPFVAPSNPVESDIAEAWEKTLGVARVGVEDDFFELGGDSLTALTIAADLSSIGIAVTPLDIYESETVSGLTRRSEAGENVQGLELSDGSEVPIIVTQGSLANAHCGRSNVSIVTEILGVPNALASDTASIEALLREVYPVNCTETAIE